MKIGVRINGEVNTFEAESNDVLADSVFGGRASMEERGITFVDEEQPTEEQPTEEQPKEAENDHPDNQEA